MRLGLNQDEGEKWIVNLIRDTRVDAKIDYKEGTVVMNHPPQSVYQQVIERTKGGFFRTQVLRYIYLHEALLSTYPFADRFTVPLLRNSDMWLCILQNMAFLALALRTGGIPKGTELASMTGMQPQRI